MATTTSRPPTGAAQRTPAANWLLGIGLTCLGLFFVFILTLMFGRVSGEEFSPTDFERRSFHYYELPIVGVQVWPLKRFDIDSDLHDHLQLKQLLPKSTDEPRWDLVRGYRGNTTVEKGDAAFLCDYLDLRNYQGENVWLAWTQAHPQFAQAFWPRIHHLAQQELYIFMPDLFEFALNAKQADADDFAPALQARLANKYYEFGLAQQQGDHHRLAVELLTEAVKLAPEKAQWQAALEASKKQFPQAEAEPTSDAPKKAAAS